GQGDRGDAGQRGAIRSEGGFHRLDVDAEDGAEAGGQQHDDESRAQDDPGVMHFRARRDHERSFAEETADTTKPRAQPTDYALRWQGATKGFPRVRASLPDVTRDDSLRDMKAPGDGLRKSPAAGRSNPIAEELP